MLANFRLDILVPRLLRLVPSLGSQDFMWLLQWNIFCLWSSVRWPAMPIWLCCCRLLPSALTSRCHPRVSRMQSRPKAPDAKIVPFLCVFLLDAYAYGGTWLNCPGCPAVSLGSWTRENTAHLPSKTSRSHHKKQISVQSKGRQAHFMWYGVGMILFLALARIVCATQVMVLGWGCQPSLIWHTFGASHWGC